MKSALGLDVDEESRESDPRASRVEVPSSHEKTLKGRLTDLSKASRSERAAGKAVEKPRPSGCCRRRPKQPPPRRVHLRGACEPPNSCSNEVRNQKYNLLTFLPMFLYNQFKAFFNIFFLGITLSQFYPPLQVGTRALTRLPGDLHQSARARAVPLDDQRDLRRSEAMAQRQEVQLGEVHVAVGHAESSPKRGSKRSAVRR